MIDGKGAPEAVENFPPALTSRLVGLTLLPRPLPLATNFPCWFWGPLRGRGKKVEARLSVNQVAFECLCQWVSAGDTRGRAWAHQSHPVHRPIGLLLTVPVMGKLYAGTPYFVQKDAPSPPNKKE